MPGKRRSRWVLWATMTAAALPVLYVLSLGPGLLLCRYNMVDNASYRTFYHPIFWIMDREPLTSSTAKWYLGFWA